MDNCTAFSSIVFFLPFVHLAYEFQKRPFRYGCVSVHRPSQELKLLYHSVAILGLWGPNQQVKKKRQHYLFWVQIIYALQPYIVIEDCALQCSKEIYISKLWLSISDLRWYFKQLKIQICWSETMVPAARAKYMINIIAITDYQAEICNIIPTVLLF